MRYKKLPYKKGQKIKAEAKSITLWFVEVGKDKSRLFIKNPDNLTNGQIVEGKVNEEFFDTSDGHEIHYHLLLNREQKVHEIARQQTPNQGEEAGIQNQ